MKTTFTRALSIVIIYYSFSFAGKVDTDSLKEIVRENPHDFKAVSALACDYIARENYQTAEQLLLNYLAYDSTDARALYLYGRIMDLTDNIMEAMAYYLLAIEKDSTLWRPYRDLAMLYDVLADYETMNRFMLNALRFSPCPESLYYDLGYSFDMLDQTDSAMEYYMKAIEFDSTDSQALMNIGAIWGNRGEADSAKFYTDKSIKFNDQSPGANFNYAEIMLMKDDTLEAISYFSRALALNPDLYAANKRLGELFEARGDSSMAKLYYEEFLKDAPMIYADDIDEVKNKLSHYK